MASHLRDKIKYYLLFSIETKGRKEAYRMEQKYKGSIVCIAPSSSPAGFLRKEFYKVDYLDVLHM